MNRLHPPLLLPTLLLPILLLAGCGAEGPAESGETGGTGAAPSSVGPVADVVPEQDTCRSLFDQDGSGLFTEVTGWLMDGKQPDQENAAEASALSTRMEDVEAVAEPDFAPMIGVLRDPLDRFAAAWNAQDSWNPGSAYRDVAPHVIERCSQYLPDPTVQALISASRTRTGDFEGDVAATGFLTGNYSDWREITTQSLCQPTDAQPQHHLEDALSTRLWVYTNDPASIEPLRLVIAYDCPERSDALDKALTAIELERDATGT